MPCFNLFIVFWIVLTVRYWRVRKINGENSTNIASTLLRLNDCGYSGINFCQFRDTILQKHITIPLKSPAYPGRLLYFRCYNLWSTWLVLTVRCSPVAHQLELAELNTNMIELSLYGWGFWAIASQNSREQDLLYSQSDRLAGMRMTELKVKLFIRKSYQLASGAENSNFSESEDYQVYTSFITWIRTVYSWYPALSACCFNFTISLILMLNILIS